MTNGHMSRRGSPRSTRPRALPRATRAAEHVLDRGDIEAARPRAARTGGRRGRPPPRRRARRSRRAPRPTTSTASSPTLRAHARRRPRSSSFVVYEPSGRSPRARRSCARAPARSTRASRCGTPAPPGGRARAARRRRSRRAARRPPACCPRSRPCASTPRASGSRTTPRPSRACGARPRRPSRRASARGPSSASWTIAGVSSPSGCIADLHPQLAQLLAQRREPLGILVQDRREQRRLRDLERLGDVRARRPAPPEAITGTETASATARRDLEVVALARAVGVDRREQDLPGAALLGLARPLDACRAPSRSCRRACARARPRCRSRRRPPASRASRPAR